MRYGMAGHIIRQNTPRRARLRAAATLAAALILTLSTSSCGRDDNPLVIAAVGPLTGPAAARGKDMQRAADFAAEEANAAGGINKRKVQIAYYDDMNKAPAAVEAAEKITSGTSTAVAVLAHVSSSAAYAASKVYKTQHILAITGAASERRITRDNPWSFRMFKSAEGQGVYMADYARHRFATNELVIVRETGTAGDEFAIAARDRALGKKIKILGDFEFAPKQANDGRTLAEIAAKIKTLSKVTPMIVLGTQFEETPAALKALKDVLGDFGAMGYSSIANNEIAAPFAKAKEERHNHGFYTNNLLVAAPDLADVGPFTQTLFADRFKARYGIEPSPETIRWYEAAKLVLSAAAAKGVDGKDKAADRTKIRDYIAALDNSESAAPGVGGPISFDEEHNIERPLSVGVFHGGRLNAAPVQLIQVDSPERIQGWDKLVARDRVIEADGMKFVKTPVVYTGIDLNSFENIDTTAGNVTADFFIWFRFQDDVNLDLHEVEFPTVVSGAQLGKEVWSGQKNGFTTITYHVKGVFRADYEFSRFPFDKQTLRIPVQFHNSNNYSLLLACGQAGILNAHGESKSLPTTDTKLWTPISQLLFRDVVQYKASFGDQSSLDEQADVNRVNASVVIERDTAGYAVKNSLPIVCVLIAILIGYALAPGVLDSRISLGVTALLTTSVLYQKLATDLPSATYMTAMDYVFFTLFGVCVLFLALTVFTYERTKRDKPLLTKKLSWGGAIVTVVLITVTLAYDWFRYWRA